MHEYILIADNLHYIILGCEKRKRLDNAGSYGIILVDRQKTPLSSSLEDSL